MKVWKSLILHFEVPGTFFLDWPLQEAVELDGLQETSRHRRDGQLTAPCESLPTRHRHCSSLFLPDKIPPLSLLLYSKEAIPTTHNEDTLIF